MQSFKENQSEFVCCGEVPTQQVSKSVEAETL